MLTKKILFVIAAESVHNHADIIITRTSHYESFTISSTGYDVVIAAECSSAGPGTGPAPTLWGRPVPG